ncbi:helix-turn-helix domain-containing protein [Jannaschia sp. S6380]|uniref:GlxA family transcriptional regulator n=1 Tax=Jannaschia sp. S6380 TaxID=2926408 RepID=UPI001FF6E344|nr:helix-turn-helix domain-containing protein [Jannaschia sp. S6380]MCK0168297.1 helix-turn-helix domain-containing protein [Jannaschia sp. S6380]
MACLTSTIEPLRAANEIVGRGVFSWTLLAEAVGPIVSSAGVEFEAETALRNADPLDILLILGAPVSRFRDPQAGNATLRDLARHGIGVGAISGGVFLLMRSGVMVGRPVSVHWCYEAAFRQEFPQADARSDVIVENGRHPTISGAAAAFDFALALVDASLGGDVAHEVACWFQHPPMRGAGVRQRVPRWAPPTGNDALPDLVARCVAIMCEDLSDPVTVDDLADRVGVSSRHIRRAFAAATGDGPNRYLRGMRMRAARQMVLYSDTGMGTIAGAVGFGNLATMTAYYRQAFDVTPSEDRARINAFRVEGDLPLPR